MKHENESASQEQAGLLLPTEAEIRDLRSALTRRMVTAPDVDSAWEKVSASMSDTASAEEQESTARVRFLPAFRKWVLYGSAAVAVCVMFFLWFSPNTIMKDSNPGIAILAQKTDVTDVTMTVEQVEWDGKRATKREEHIAEGTNITFEQHKSDNTALPTVIMMTTPRGKDCHITLSDGTRVWMNTDSQLEFPEHFMGSRRTVRLSGEAYFEVAKDRQHPFVVESSYFTTTVLGTTFNVRAYSPTDASVALVEGRVSVKPATGGKTVVMAPGQLATLSNRQGALSLSKVDTYFYTQRKDGFFYFPNETMREIMVELGRWYNKTVVFEEAGDMDMRLHFVAERTQSLPQIINSLCEMDGVDIELGTNEIVVK